MGNRVGSVVTRSVAGPLSLGQPPTFVPFIILLAARGPVDVPTRVAGLNDFRAKFGEAVTFADGVRYSEGFEVLKAYFAKGGAGAVVLRVAGDTAAPMALTLSDRGVGAAEANTLTVTGKGPGTSLHGMSIVVTAGQRINTVNLTLTDAAGRTVETFDTIKLDAASIERVNDASNWIMLADAGSDNDAPTNLPALGSTTFDTASHGGVDNNAPNAAAIVGTSVDGVKTGLKAFRSLLLGPGFLIAPGLDADVTVKAELVSQSEAFFRMVFTSSEVGATVATAKTQRAQWDAFNVGFSFPRPRVRDELTGELKSISGVGHIIADYIRALNEDGPGKAPGGRNFRMDAGVVSMETQANGQPLIDEAVAEGLVAAGINPIWDKDNTGARVWGARAATSDAAWQYLNAAYLYCLIGYTFKTQLGRLALDLADVLFFDDVEDGMFIFMAGLHLQRAFRGDLPTSGQTANPEVHAFGVQCDESLLSASDKGNGNVRAKVWYRPAGVAETILIDIAKQNEVS